MRGIPPSQFWNVFTVYDFYCWRECPPNEKLARWPRLFCDRAERQHSLAEQFVEHLRQAGVNRGESAQDSFITGEIFEAGTCRGVITDGEQKTQESEGGAYKLQRTGQAEVDP